MHNFVKALNQFYLTSPELFEEDFSWKGFDWIIPDDNMQNILVMRRMDNKGGELIYAVNFSPVTRENYCFGVDSPDWEEVFTTDNTEWGGSGITNGKLKATKEQFRGKKYKLSMTIPAFSGVFLRKKSKDIRLA